MPRVNDPCKTKELLFDTFTIFNVINGNYVWYLFQKKIVGKFQNIGRKVLRMVQVYMLSYAALLGTKKRYVRYTFYGWKWWLLKYGNLSSIIHHIFIEIIYSFPILPTTYVVQIYGSALCTNDHFDLKSFRYGWAK